MKLKKADRDRLFAMLAAHAGAPLTWGVLPGRHALHVIVPVSTAMRTTKCGLSGAYHEQEIGKGTSVKTVCEQCAMSVLTSASPGRYKFFYDHIPADVRRRRRLVWREFLQQWRHACEGAGEIGAVAP